MHSPILLVFHQTPTVMVEIIVKHYFGSHHLVNMHDVCLDTPNNKNRYSIESLMVRNPEIDTKIAFLAHLVLKLEPNLFSGC